MTLVSSGVWVMPMRALWAGAVLSSLFLTSLAFADNNEWLSQKVEHYEKQARWWQHGWLAFHGTSSVIEGYEANRTHSKAVERAKTVSAVASGLGVADLLLEPLDISEGRNTTEAAFRLKNLAERIEEKSSWRGHLAGWLTGLVGGMLITGGHGKESDGWEFFALSGLVTEMQIWTLPKDAVQDWKNYQRMSQISCIDNRMVSFKPAAARAIRHGIEVLWWF